jgi:hypothetical protein
MTFTNIRIEGIDFFHNITFNLKIYIYYFIKMRKTILTNLE